MSAEDAEKLEEETERAEAAGAGRIPVGPHEEKQD